MSVSNTDEMDEESRSLKSRAQNANSKIENTYGIVSRVNNKRLCRLTIGGIRRKRLRAVTWISKQRKPAYDAWLIDEEKKNVSSQ